MLILNLNMPKKYSQNILQTDIIKTRIQSGFRLNESKLDEPIYIFFPTYNK